LPGVEVDMGGPVFSSMATEVKLTKIVAVAMPEGGAVDDGIMLSVDDGISSIQQKIT